MTRTSGTGIGRGGATYSDTCHPYPQPSKQLRSVTSSGTVPMGPHPTALTALTIDNIDNY